MITVSIKSEFILENRDKIYNEIRREIKEFKWFAEWRKMVVLDTFNYIVDAAKLSNHVVLSSSEKLFVRVLNKVRLENETEKYLRPKKV